ncbi:chemotaxis protein CheW [Rhodospirillum rubrum]|uniref:chemotaxis protein CheW n=1 Tax=Rhodospirillum rubrum TaxID=1085 RepID=UPI001908A7F4|nr:chemotaxis protein CheW [Rhodospirillum rubrum]MBK1665439.1 chemotaxis protein CheW [Rhodospirillum rubrum]MBK1677375.1 chemotaxis protein CheW [Rhodospirillum rubrum]
MSEITQAALDSGPDPSQVTGGAAAGAIQAGNARQFVIFHVDNDLFAVPLSEVQEIIRMPDVVCVPLSPAALEGLANLRGSVLPVIRLRHVFGMAPVAHDDATRVVVLDQGRPVGLVVDRVANVVSVEADHIEPSGAIGGTVDTDLLTGMIKGDGDRAMVMILDAAKVVAREFQAIGAAPLAPSLGEAGRAEDGRVQATTDGDDESQLVSFEVAGQEYALPIERVQEIVQIPNLITDVPNTPAHVLGVMTLRNRLLPLVGLREMFGLPTLALTETNKIVVVSLEGGGSGSGRSVGVVMDSVKEVLRVGHALIDPMPALLARTGNLGEIEAICRLQGGNRLVSILSADAMFNSDEIRAVAANALGEEDAVADEKTPGHLGITDDEEQFVAFRLMNEEYGVPIDSVQEIVRVPEELTRVPKTPDFIEGVVNLRGVVLPVVDQRRRFGLPGMERNDRQRIMVYTIRGVRTGFIVDSVSEVIRIPASLIGPAPVLSDEQQRLIRRVANIEKQKRMILLLDVEQLLDGKELAVVGSVIP